MSESNWPAFRIVHGDARQKLNSLPDKSVSLVVTSPPYNIGKEYEKNLFQSLEHYAKSLEEIIHILVRKLADNGSICWQVGNYIGDNEIVPLDFLFYNIFRKHGLKLQNRIVWRFNFGLNSRKKLSGRYETVLWLTKSKNYKFHLDRVRVPQLYPGKRHSKKKGEKAGKPSGNPLGKNPSDFWEFSGKEFFVDQPIWELPNVKSKHPEKTIHPCQFPMELVERCILAFTDPDDLVLDPFLGTGTTVVASLKNGRRGFGIETDERYIDLARSRVRALKNGSLSYRPTGKPIDRPNMRDRVAQVPLEWVLGEMHRGEKEEEKEKSTIC